ncbi:MAG: ParB/RepB/Spo0J family partition protein, partial [Planctomycetota bacterium]|nr:ParB/RepB/Spo0J family partition protein [Planctomycetota bacterium]
LIGRDGGDVPTRAKSARAKTATRKLPEKKARAKPPAKKSDEAGKKTAAAGGGDSGPAVLMVNPAEIQENPQQPRKDFPLTELEALKTSLARDGFLQPLLARKEKKGYLLVAGERRLRASRELGLEEVPIMLSEADDDKLLELALIENLHRDDLNPIELGEAYKGLMQVKSCTQEQVAEQLGLSRSAVSNTIRLLELPADIKKALVRGQITAGHAKVLLSASSAADQRMLFERIAVENLSVRETEAALRGDDLDLEVEAAEKPGRKRPKQAEKDPNVLKLEEELMESLGARVAIRVRGKRKQQGVLSISFNSQDEFERLREKLLAPVDVV